MRGLRAQVTRTEVARKAAEQLRIARETELTGCDTVASASGKSGEMQTKVANTEADVIKERKNTTDFSAKPRESEPEIVQLVKRHFEDAEGNPAESTNPSIAQKTTSREAQHEKAMKQLDTAERERALLPGKVTPSREQQTTPPGKGVNGRQPGGENPGIRGTVLAVNQTYKFVVLSLGGRHGVEPNSEMLVLRGSSFIGRIRISSVEPATAIGDIIASSLAPGVQVQPGDTVIYAGTKT